MFYISASRGFRLGNGSVFQIRVWYCDEGGKTFDGETRYEWGGFGSKHKRTGLHSKDNAQFLVRWFIERGAPYYNYEIEYEERR